MATLNLNEKKIPSAENLRLIAQLCISLANKQSSLEDRCIAPWKSGEVYQKGISYVSYNDYLYFCTVSNSDTDFVESHWTKLSDTISELTKADIEALVNLTPEQITNLQSLIDDTSISTTHTNSSSHIYMAIQDAIAECKDDTLKQIAKKVSGSYKIANTTADIVSADYIYLLSNGSNYDLYVLVDGTATKVGDTNIDLSEYVKTTDLADYMKTSDADGKFATITTVDGKVDKTSIATTLSDTSTDDEVPSAKVVYDNAIKDKNLKTYTTLEQLGLADGCSVEDIYLKLPDNSYFECGVDTSQSVSGLYNLLNVPQANGLLTIRKYNSYRFSLEYKLSASGGVTSNELYIGQLKGSDGSDLTWSRVCTTTVADTNGYGILSNDATGSVEYRVINGVCYVYIQYLAEGLTGTGVLEISGLPKQATIVNVSLENFGNRVGTLYSQDDLTFNIHKSSTAAGYGSFSYKVAES